MQGEIKLRDVLQSDLNHFYNHQQDPIAQKMAAFIHKDPSDRNNFDDHWKKIMNLESVTIKTILFQDKIAGHIAKFVMEGKPELTYWIDKQFWRKGITTQALRFFLEIIVERPIYARAAKDNISSIRVLEKCGFEINGYDKGFANARGIEIEEVIMKLN